MEHRPEHFVTHWLRDVFVSMDEGVEDTEWWDLADDGRPTQLEDRRLSSPFNDACWVLYARNVLF
jgi:hypothetical protein